MSDRLLTSRPIRIEDGRDVGGRREGEKSGARRRDRVVFLPAPRGPYCLQPDSSGPSPELNLCTPSQLAIKHSMCLEDFSCGTCVYIEQECEKEKRPEEQ
ncbi:hypothetical protein NDU88_003359 [Pleurodeles waltl]|uniref:Uncharacterized protein n=1 Tax=Pleurodeles waltl TaxID=8319 RepID=A0AAV7T4V0_PLEWA|nr:hypothetical protein NDU88_003359 [Pleurodeles waltl]